MICAVVAGCAAGPGASPEQPAFVMPERSAIIQSIPRGCWVEVDGEYLGRAPVVATVRTYENGAVARPVRVRVSDLTGGAYEEKVWAPGQRWPEKILFDVRPFMAHPGGVRLGP